MSGHFWQGLTKLIRTLTFSKATVETPILTIGLQTIAFFIVAQKAKQGWSCAAEGRI